MLRHHFHPFAFRRKKTVKFLFDHLSQGDSAVHALDARAKAAVTLVFTVAVVSVPNHAVGPLFFFFAWPAGMMAAARLSPLPFLRRALVLSPLIVMVAGFNPFFEAGHVVARPLGLSITLEGLLTSAGIAVKFLACLVALLVLVATTPFPALISGIRGIGVPGFLTGQVSFIYRYLFILLSQARSMKRARDSRSFGWMGPVAAFHSAAAILGFLFVRTLKKGERVQLAMDLRGFAGRFESLEERRPGAAEALFLFLSLALIAFCFWMVRGGIHA